MRGRKVMKKKFNQVYQFKITLKGINHPFGRGYKFRKPILFMTYTSLFKMLWAGMIVIFMNLK